LGFIDIRNDFVLHYFVLLIFLHGFPHHLLLIRSPFGEVLKANSRECGACDLAWLRGRSVQARRFRTLCCACRSCGRYKAIVFQLASLADVTRQISGEVMLMTLVDGTEVPLAVSPAFCQPFTERRAIGSGAISVS
jgi:branched-chain amino acid transport system permease protein